MDELKVALLSCGLGHVNRGFEISTVRWYRALRDQPGLAVRLFSGGEHAEATRIAAINRDAWLSGPVSWLPGLDDRRRWQAAYVMEQITFGIGLLPHRTGWVPDVVWTKEVPLAHFLHYARALFNLKYKIIFANGAPFNPRTYAQFDFIQQLQRDSYEEAAEFGIPPDRMRIIPNCVPVLEPSAGRAELRQTFGYSQDDWIVVCVAAWNRYHKRLDYLIEEIASISDPAMKLLLCGHPETETAGLKALAQEKLGDRVSWRTLSEQQIRDALHLSDVFVLTSLAEGLGSVLIEAAMAGLPVICHPHGGSKFILEDPTWMVDLSRRGALAAKLTDFRAQPPHTEKLKELQSRAVSRFSDRVLAPQFKQMVEELAVARRPSRRLLGHPTARA